MKTRRRRIFSMVNVFQGRKIAKNSADALCRISAEPLIWQKKLLFTKLYITLQAFNKIQLAFSKVNIFFTGGFHNESIFVKPRTTATTCFQKTLWSWPDAWFKILLFFCIVLCPIYALYLNQLKILTKTSFFSGQSGKVLFSGLCTIIDFFGSWADLIKFFWWENLK